MTRIGIRELRQRASEYLRRVEAGETIEVTDRGRPIALLTPIPVAPPIEKLRAFRRHSPSFGEPGRSSKAAQTQVRPRVTLDQASAASRR